MALYNSVILRNARFVRLVNLPKMHLILIFKDLSFSKPCCLALIMWFTLSSFVSNFYFASWDFALGKH